MTLLFRVSCSIYFITFQLSRCEKVLYTVFGHRGLFYTIVRY